ncbi:MAG: biosynthetic peptidoglycan transglycosylase [Bacteroidota bacterium]
MPDRKGKLSQVLYAAAFSILALTMLTFILRSPIASWYLQRRIELFNKSYNAELKISKVRILGIASIQITGISLRPANGDTLMKIDTVYASIGILKLFAGRLSLHNVELKNSWFLPKNNDKSSNYGFLFQHSKVRNDTIDRTSEYAAATENLIRFIFDKIPLSLKIRNFNLSYTIDDHIVGLHIDEVAITSHYFRTAITVCEDSVQQRWALAGRIDNSSRLAEFRLFPADGNKIRIPFIHRKWQANMKFDTLAFGFSALEATIAGRVRLGGFALIRGLVIDHRMIAGQPVEFDKLAVDYTFNIGKDFIEIDSSSTVTFNRIDFHPYLRFRPKPTKQITIKVNKPSFAAQDLFSSFPPGLFTNLDGICVTGNLSWYLDFFADLSQPDSLRFETALSRHQFSILSFGNSDLTKINEPFIYTAWDKDQPVRTFIVGAENPDFRRLDQISHFLPVAVMTSEDGGFYQHRGFLPDAFREAMIANIKERRFARGGSTISMQLIKNVFLNRNKTVARKLEEALIVWLIENQELCSKERMFEVYLNIIEWGPLIYGANEASRFYFNKDASKLTLAEAIFMASIIPRPKWFRYSFDENGRLRESNAEFYRLVSEKMVRKGWITSADAENLIPDVELKGAAKLELKKHETSPPDSTEIPE